MIMDYRNALKMITEDDKRYSCHFGGVKFQNY